jgi:o-succinylbenzoate synthase
MRIERIELVRVGMPLVRPFRTSFGIDYAKDALLVRITTDSAEGWGECVAMASPSYSSEYNDGAIDVITRFLVPPLVKAGDVSAQDCRRIWSGVRGHRMSKAAVEMAILDAESRADGRSFAQRLGSAATHVPSGVSVGIPADDSLDTLMAEVSSYVDAGYRRIKLKIEPGWDIEPTRTVRDAYPDTPLQVDANQAYGVEDIKHLTALDEFNLLLIEQPFAEEDLVSHAALAKAGSTPVCLDESIVDVTTLRQALALKAVDVVNIKPGRVGGYLEAVDIHDVCLDAGVPVWCGGMVETGVGRAANVALAGLPGFTLPGDVSASDRFYTRDLITEPFVLRDGGLDVPTGPGLGVDVDEQALHDLAVWRHEIPLS